MMPVETGEIVVDYLAFPDEQSPETCFHDHSIDAARYAMMET
jgi:hypothetical protein